MATAATSNDLNNSNGNVTGESSGSNNIATTNVPYPHIFEPLDLGHTK